MGRLNRQAMLDAASLCRDLLAGAYPPFIYGTSKATIPVFCFHGVDPVLLERQLQFLAANGYRAITTDDLETLICGPPKLSHKLVMLTYDDGWGSLWSVGLPLFKKYGVKVVVFLAAGRIRDESAGPNLDDLQAGRCRPGDVLGRDSSRVPLLTWDEVREMHKTGLVDFQSHTFTHGKVFCSPKIVDYLHPALLKRYTIFQVPEWDGNSDHALGRPIYRSAPRMSRCRRYIDDGGLRRTCEEYVVKAGGSEFFLQPGWRLELEHLTLRFRETCGDAGRYETNEEREQALLGELVESRKLIEDRLPGKIVRHVCYPWHCYSRLAVKLSSRAGYATSFVGKVSGRYSGVQASDLNLVARVGGDFFFRLPGRGRLSLLKVLLGKFARRALVAGG